MEKLLLQRIAKLEASVRFLESLDLGFTKEAGVQPLQDLAGVQTWVSKNRNDGLLDDTSAPKPSREDYQDGVPQRDRVLPLPSGHPEGRTEYRAGPPVLNTPPDSSGASLSHGQAPNPNALPNQPDGKPLHQRPRSSAVPGDNYGHPYVDAKNTTGLSRRPKMASDKEAVPKAKINVRPPRERQREQKGTLKRVTQRAYRAKKRKDRGQMARDARRRYLRNKTRILLYQQRRADKPKLHKRLTGGGNSTMKQKNSKKAMQRQAIRSVFSRMYRSVPVDHVRHIDFVASQNKPVNEKLWSDVIDLAKGERKTPLSVGGVEVAPVRGGEGFRKYPSAYANGWASKTYKDLGGTWKKEASHQDPALATLQVLLAILRGAHWAHWTSHWQVKGTSYYGDHELLQRIYEGLIEEIDTLAEKIVGKYGSQAVAPVDQAQIMANTLLPLAEAEAQSDPILRALIIEEALQKVFKNVYDALKQVDAMSLGMDDFIMSMANAHETFQYLLRQRHAKQIGDDMNDIKSYLIKTAYENEEVRGVFLPLLSLKTASEEELVSRTLRLAHEYPALRGYVLPFFGVELFKEAGSKGNKGKNKQKRKQKREMKNRRRENAVKKEKNKSRNPMGVAPVNQSAFEKAMARERGRLQGGTQKDYAFSTIWGYAMDEGAELHQSAVKVMKGWVEKWNQSEAKKKVSEGAKKAGEVATQALEDSKVVKEVAGALLEEVGNAGMALSQRLAESAEGDFKQAKQNYMIAEEELGKRFGKEAGKYIGEVKKTLKETLEKEDSVQGNVEYKGRESQLSEGLALVKEGLMGCARKHLAKSSAEVKIKGAVRGAKTKTTAGAVAKAAPRGLFGLVKGIGSALGTTISMGAQSAGSAMQSKDGIDFGLGKTAADHEEAKQAVIKYLSLVEAEDIEYVQKFIDEDGVFDVDALKADLDKKNADFEKALLADLEASTKKVEEEAEKQDKEVEKKEVRIIERELGEDAFVAKTAVLKLAYDNPKYRPQLLQLLQVPRSHFAVAEIRDLLQRG